MALKKAEMESVTKLAKSNQKVARLGNQYLRHRERIKRLERVLDPEDVNAVLVGNGTEETVKAEIERRTAQMAAVGVELRQIIGED